MEEEEGGVESRKSRKEQERERRRLRDRKRRQFMSQDERERHLARRRKNYQLRRQRAELHRIQTVAEVNQQPTPTSPPPCPRATNNIVVPLVDESDDQSVGIPMEALAKMTGTIRLSRVKHLARKLSKSSVGTSVEACNKVATRCAMSNGLRLSHVKRLVRAKGQQEEMLLLSQHYQTQVSREH
ncbi:unnamed protein product [Cochlearia groenlandica]